MQRAERDIEVVVLETAPSTFSFPENSSTVCSACVKPPCDGAGKRCMSNPRTAPGEVAGAVVEEGAGTSVNLPAVQCTHAPRS